MKSDKTLVLFTSSFPFGKGEQFIETEILYLAERFREVHIFPLTTEGHQRAIPANVKIMRHNLYRPYNRLKLLAAHPGTVLSIFLNELRVSPHTKKYLKRPKHFLNYILHRLNDSKWLHTQLEKYDGNSTVFYSYWFNYWAFILSMIKYTSRKELKFFTRIHQGDYAEEGRKGGFFPFRFFEMQQVSAVYPVSHYGYNYVRERYPVFKNHLRVFYLGVNDQGDNPFTGNEPFHIVTCSFLNARKRVHLVVDILKHLKFPVKWTHFGEGELMEEIRTKAQKELPANVSVEFKGHVANADVLDFYRRHPVDLFINVSELEGIPVSIMEAISFGIPTVGCRICGVPEIVTGQTGFLLEKVFDPEKAAATITGFHQRPAEDKKKFRDGVKAFWSKNFNSVVNYPAFHDEIA
jgi:glycosyltransferase involved in cell wall biosynthesis